MPDREQLEELWRSEQRFRATFEQAAVGMAHVAPDGRLLRVNSVFCSMLDHEGCEDLVGTHVQDITHPTDLAEDLREMDRLVAGDLETYALTKRYFRAGGTIMWGRNTVSLVRTPEGEPDYFVSVLVDVTPRIESERRLRESEELFRSAFEQAAVGMALAGRPGEPWMEVNERFCRIVGYTCDELLRMTPMQIAHPDDRPLDSEQAEEVWSGRSPRASREKRYVRKDGGIVWVERHLSVVRDATGQPSRFLVVVQDISERVEAQERLRTTENRYRLLFENALEGVTIYRVVRDDRGRFVDLMAEDVNPAQLKTLGAAKEAVVGRTLQDQYGPGEVMRPYVELAKGVIGEGRPRRMEVYFEPSDRYYLISAYPLEEDMWAIIAMDITLVRRAQEDLKRHDEEIRQAYEDVLDAVTGGKLALMTHEELHKSLGEPLTEEIPVTAPPQLAEARARIREALGGRYPDLASSMKVLNPVGEALNNALKHGGGGTFRVYDAGGAVQVEVSDSGPGIDFRALPRSTLVSGYSTTATLGVGFTLMLQLSDRVLLATSPGHTSVVLEAEAD